MLILFLYLLQVCVSFYLIVEAWRFEDDLTLGCAIGFGILSFIPVCFISAIIYYLIEFNDHRVYKPIVILKKKVKNG